MDKPISHTNDITPQHTMPRNTSFPHIHTHIWKCRHQNKRAMVAVMPDVAMAVAAVAVVVT